MKKSILVEKRYLNLPVKNGAQTSTITISQNSNKTREFEIELAQDNPDFYVFCDLTEFIGQEIEINNGTAQVFDVIEQSNVIKDSQDLYQEKLRPQFHFTSKRGWINDPNGLVYFDGEYHLFYQHNPYGIGWGNMHWGHAVSTDLLHWQELGDALYPDEMGTMYSGSGVVDINNTTGFQTCSKPPLVVIYTAAGGNSKWSKDKPYSQCLAYSNDKGRTWTKYENNPVLEQVCFGNRDPKVFWHEPTQKWIMVLFIDNEDNDFAIFTSTDLKSWKETDIVKIKDDRECPDLFELPVNDDPDNKKWVYWGANGKYLIGTFDGEKFVAESESLDSHHGNHSYAAQTWSDIPKEDGRRIQITWATFDIPQMPFNKYMTFPVELTLKNTDEGIRVFTYPIKEIENLHSKKHVYENVVVNDIILKDIDSELLDINTEIELSSADSIDININGTIITYDVKEQKLICLDKAAPMKPQDGKISLRILVDSTSIEIYANNGRVFMPMGVIGEDEGLKLSSTGDAKISILEVNELNSIWNNMKS
jgi:sucrose-6-phosphate hydrolase SacC (GH32 family)